MDGLEAVGALRAGILVALGSVYEHPLCQATDKNLERVSEYGGI